MVADEAVEEAGGGEHQRPGADGRGEPARSRGAARTQSRIGVAGLEQRPGADAAGHDDDVGRRDLVERGVDGETEEAVVGADLAALGADEGDGGAGEALEDLVGADGVERGDLGEQGDGDVHGMAPGLVGWTVVRMRRPGGGRTGGGRCRGRGRDGGGRPGAASRPCRIRTAGRPRRGRPTPCRGGWRAASTRTRST